MVLNSNITVTNITSEVGVVAYESIVTVDGEISSPTYIVADGLLKEKDDGVAGTGPDAGYMLYTSGESTIRVKIPRNKTYTVSYHPNGALCEAPADMNRYCRGDKVTLADGKGLLNPGYEFAGWELADGTLVTEPFIMGESDVTLYARWN
jgi:uncharacterized repeat protein (TIGR02543 family)